MKIPGPDHPISITPTEGRVTVTLGGKIVAVSRRALTLREANYPAVQYIPRADAQMALLARSSRTTHCPYKGDAAYYSTGDAENVVWTYEEPYPAVREIAGHLAFYPNMVDSIAIEP